MSLATIYAKGENLPLANQSLVDMLAEEFRNPSSENKQPYFQVQKQPPLDRVRIVVVWDIWKELSHQERAEVILDAYENWQGETSALKVSVAMGLTQREAERLGLRVEVETGEPVRIG